MLTITANTLTLQLPTLVLRQVSSGPSAERLKDKYQSKVAEVEEQAKQLKEKQREIKETHTTGLSQIDMMNDLIKLLQIKVWGWVAGCVESQLGCAGRGKGASKVKQARR